MRSAAYLVNEHVLAAVVRRYEAPSLGYVEPFALPSPQVARPRGTRVCFCGNRRALLLFAVADKSMRTNEAQSDEAKDRQSVESAQIDAIGTSRFYLRPLRVCASGKRTRTFASLSVNNRSSNIRIPLQRLWTVLDVPLICISHDSVEPKKEIFGSSSVSRESRHHFRPRAKKLTISVSE